LVHVPTAPPLERKPTAQGVQTALATRLQAAARE
jgi:hypothetical protein